MNILLVTPFQLTDVGGVSVIVRMLYREWSRRGHTVSILAPGDTTSVQGGLAPEGEPVYRVCLRLPYIGVAPWRAFLSFWLHFPLTLLTLARFLHRQRVDLVLLQYPLPWVFYFALLRPFSRWKLVAALQGSDVHKLPVYNPMDRRLVRWALRASDVVLAASQSLLAELRVALPGLEMLGTSVIPNGAPSPDAMPDIGARPRAGLPDAYLLTVGQVIHRKGLDVLIQALCVARAQGHVLNLVVAGDGPELPHLLGMAKTVGVSEQIRFLGNQRHDEVLALIKGCEFFVLASRAEGLPLVLMEAMMARKAVVATRVDGIPEVIRHGVNGWLVPSEEANALAQGLIALHTSPALRRRLAARAQETVATEYSWTAIAGRYLEVFTRLSGGTAATPAALVSSTHIPDPRP